MAYFGWFGTLLAHMDCQKMSFDRFLKTKKIKNHQELKGTEKNHCFFSPPKHSLYAYIFSRIYHKYILAGWMFHAYELRAL